MTSSIRWSQVGSLIMKAGSVFLLLALCVSLLPLPASAASPASNALVTCKFKHTVEAGDTLIYLGSLYNIDWLEIAKANDIKPPYALIVGSVLCIPGGEKPSGTPGTGTGAGDNKNKPTMAIKPEGNHILVSVENFPAKTQYYVRVFPRSTPVSYRIGHFITNKEGDFTGYFKLALYIPRSPNMAVCVKNVWTDATSCVRYDDTELAAVFTRANCSRQGR